MVLTKYKSQLTSPFNSIAKVLIAKNISANCITLATLLMAAGVCLLYVIGQVNNMLFATTMAFFSMLDSIDGAVARLGRGPTRWGSYIDAMSDRIFDAMLVLSVAHVLGHWILCFFIAVGSFTISYAKARAIMEMRIAEANINNSWPDLMERTERNFVFIGIVWVSDFFSDARFAGKDFLFWGFSLLILLIAYTIVQRLHRAWCFLKDE